MTQNLPPVMPEVPGVGMAARYRAAGAANVVGGDFYDVFPASRDKWAIVIGDVCGTGPIAAAVREARERGHRVAQAHLRHLNPFPANTGEVLRAYERVIVPEMNLGQLALLLRAKFLVDIESHTSVRGLPFQSGELATVIATAVAALHSSTDASTQETAS